MRLSKLEPRWIEKASRGIVGVVFLCPTCRVRRFRIYFRSPADKGAPACDGKTWTHVGTTFETLSLFPSIDGRPQNAHFVIADGEVIIAEDSPPACDWRDPP